MKASTIAQIILQSTFVILLILKLQHLIDWPWIWVLSPIWIPYAVLIVLWLIVLIMELFTKIVDK